MSNLKPSGSGAAALVMIASLWLTTPSAIAANGTPDCRYSRAVSCHGPVADNGYHSYERWQDGSPAVGSSAPAHYGPNYFHGYNSLYGFGR